MNLATKLKYQYSPKLTEFYKLQLTFGVYFLIKSIELKKCGYWNFRKLNCYVMAHQNCGDLMKDKSVTKCADNAANVFEKIYNSNSEVPEASEQQISQLWKWYLAFIDDINHVPRDVFGIALQSAYASEERAIKQGTHVSRDALLSADIHLGLVC